MIVSSLYIHIPFCVSKCTYCDFFSVPTKKDSALFASYIESLKKEIIFYIKKYKVDTFKTLYIGGGTPSLLPNDLLVQLFSTIKKYVKIDANAEITIEANPQDITKELLEMYKSLGINRLSIGVQCYSDEVLKLLKRRATKADIKNALSLIKENWLIDKNNFSVDLISGLPDLSDNDFIAGIDFVTSFNPTHISLYSLMVEEGTILDTQIKKGMIEYSDEKNDLQWLLGRDYLISKGYAQYEVSNFAKGGHESVHNCVYWHLENYIGCGAGATGTVDNYRWNNAPNVKAYIDYWQNLGTAEHNGTENDRAITVEPVNLCTADSCVQSEWLTLDDKKNEFLMLGFRLSKGVNSATYKQKFGEDLLTKLSANDKNSLFCRWQQKGYAKIEQTSDGEQISLSKEGLQFLNTFLESIE